MNQIAIQWDVIITLYILFSWCHGGITNINCSGHVWVEPSTVFKMGMNVSVYCQAVIRNCQPRTFHFYKNANKEELQITRINETTAQLQYTNFMEPHASMYCIAECLGQRKMILICGEDISSGYPPDAPKEVTCVIHEYSGNMTCTWNTGKLTYIATKYVVHVKSLETEEEQQYLASSFINISTDSLQGGKKYLVWVQAANVLGTETSEPLQIDLDDIVIPSASIIVRAENINATVPKTIVYWNSQTTIEKVSCEMRYRATKNQTWNVRKFDANFTYVQQSEFYLESNTTYVFQVRCQQTGNKYWQPWSSSFIHKMPETISQVMPKSVHHNTQNPGLLVASIFKEQLTFDNRQDIGLLLGMVFCAVLLSILSLIVIFNRSLRTRIKRRILLLIPKWLHEDIPNMENSNVLKLLQDKSELMNADLSEQVSYADPVITEIGEIILSEKRKPAGAGKERSTGFQETHGCLQDSLSASSLVYIPDLNTGYKPQISNILTKSDERASSTLETPANTLDLGRDFRFKTQPHFAFSISSMNSLSNTLLFEELSVILNQGECSHPDIENSVDTGASMLLGNSTPNETEPEQTLLPDEFVSCLGIMNKELPSPHSYFPQNILENNFKKILLLEK
ncbi:interleukin-23 receptor [Ochotona curzoniae]|uniref:interleukin-23 receptor n=1 Tax=Ochotona curzoniae TaxID=130825 RepID=UPI001B350DEA|nr:interleukin-23 receptor [Ochotona curzoniae]